jgi:hypothetical protein
MIDTSRVKIVFETKDTEYEFIGFHYYARPNNIIFRSFEPDNRPIIGSIRKIHQWHYYCYSTELAMDDQAIVYWAPCRNIDAYVVFNELIGRVKEEWHT